MTPAEIQNADRREQANLVVDIYTMIAALEAIDYARRFRS
jgi:hypothetical protein